MRRATSGYLHVDVHADVSDDPERLSVDRLDFVGLTPHDLLPSARVSAAMLPGHRGAIAIRDGGRGLTGSWVFEDTPEVQRQAKFAADVVQLCLELIEIQRHALTRIVLPPADTPITWITYIHEMASLINGEAIDPGRWAGSVSFEPNDQTALGDGGVLEVLVDQLLVVDMVHHKFRQMCRFDSISSRHV